MILRIRPWFGWDRGGSGWVSADGRGIRAHGRMHDWSGSSLAALSIAAEISPDLVALKVSGPSRRLGLPGGAEVVITQLCAVVNLLVEGRAPDYVAPVQTGAGLVALRKPNGGVRPIAVGEILRRLTSNGVMPKPSSTQLK